MRGRERTGEPGDEQIGASVARASEYFRAHPDWDDEPEEFFRGDLELGRVAEEEG